MKLYEALTLADELRPNAVSSELKARYIYSLEAEFAEEAGIDAPRNPYPDNSPDELIMPYPYDDVYPLYLAAMIDYTVQDTELYTNDMAAAADAIARAKAWYRRTHRPELHGNWRVM